ncbi:MAG: hypothetical protein VKL39_22105 [Leptolyngbyaceae bacterium]|nr:hypothetical protein [Leptolyngbyaceae bacterium]
MSKPELQASSILCLDDRQTRLYVELIQVLPDSNELSRPMAWLRPFAIQVDRAAVPEELKPLGDRHPEQDAIIFDARNTSDLIWPIHFFRPGLDTEVISVLAMLPSSSGLVTVPPDKHHAARRILNQFLRQIWRDHPDDFPSSGGRSPFPD